MKKFTGLMICLISLVPMACKEDIDPVITELVTSRTFAPVGLEARVRNQVDIELEWQSESDVDQYLVEFYQDSLQFSGDPIATATIDEIPTSGTVIYTENLVGETRYSARVKAVVEGQEESKWATVTELTGAEQIFTSTVPLEITGTSATIAWEAGSEVTNFLIVPGNIVLPISDAQKTAGQATIEGLSGGTSFTVTLYNGTSKRGTIEFSTLKEADLTPLDDLGAFIDATPEGGTLVLAAGTYSLGSKEITKSITLEGQNVLDMPIVEGQLTFSSTVASVSVRFLHFRPGGDQSQFINATAATCNLMELVVEGCEISGYANNIIYNNSGGTYGDITIMDTYIHDIPGGGGDGFDIRGGTVGSLTVENSTLDNGVRTLLRMQVMADVAFRNCTFYKVCNVASGNNRGFFRMSGGGGSLEVSNCLFVETGLDDNGTIRGNWSRAGDISPEVITDYGDNYYFNVIGLFEGEYTDPSAVDATEADPGFTDPENGDFTVTNQTIIDENVGDTRWHQ